MFSYFFYFQVLITYNQMKEENGQDCQENSNEAWTFRSQDFFSKIKNHFREKSTSDCYWHCCEKDRLEPLWFVKDSYSVSQQLFNIKLFNFHESDFLEKSTKFDKWTWKIWALKAFTTTITIIKYRMQCQTGDLWRNNKLLPWFSYICIKDYAEVSTLIQKN